MKIKDIELENDIILAPMAGVTDFAFRSIARDYGACLSTTEMISAKGLFYNNENDIYERMLYTMPNEKPCAVQLFGNDPEVFAKVVKLPILQKFDIIDINMGCPAPKIVKNGEGSSLLQNLDLAEKIAKTVVENTSKPVTVKMRLGFNENELVAVELAKRLEKVGVSAITIHGRTRGQFYSGAADYEAIKKVKEAVKIPVIGNGDVFNRESYLKMKATGVDAVMIGRGALGKPWIFKEILDTNFKISKEEKVKTIKRHINLLSTVYSEKYIVNFMRKHLLWYCKEEKNANELRLKFCKIESIQEALDLLDNVY